MTEGERELLLAVGRGVWWLLQPEHLCALLDEDGKRRDKIDADLATAVHDLEFEDVIKGESGRCTE
jgi:hypothetical protein